MEQLIMENRLQHMDLREWFKSLITNAHKKVYDWGGRDNYDNIMGMFGWNMTKLPRLGIAPMCPIFDV